MHQGWDMLFLLHPLPSSFPSLLGGAAERGRKHNCNAIWECCYWFWSVWGWDLELLLLVSLMPGPELLRFTHLFIHLVNQDTHTHTHTHTREFNNKGIWDSMGEVFKQRGTTEQPLRISLLLCMGSTVPFSDVPVHCTSFSGFGVPVGWLQCIRIPNPSDHGPPGSSELRQLRPETEPWGMKLCQLPGHNRLKPWPPQLSLKLSQVSLHLLETTACAPTLESILNIIRSFASHSPLFLSCQDS